MDTMALLETLLSCMVVPLFVLGIAVFCAVILFVLDKRLFRR